MTPVSSGMFPLFSSFVRHRRRCRRCRRTCNESMTQLAGALHSSPTSRFIHDFFPASPSLVLDGFLRAGRCKQPNGRAASRSLCGRFVYVAKRATGPARPSGRAVAALVRLLRCCVAPDAGSLAAGHLSTTLLTASLF